MNVPKNSNVAATYNVSAAPGPQARSSGSNTPLLGATTPSSSTDSTPAQTRDVLRSRADTLELSSQGLRLSLTQAVEPPPPEEPPPPKPDATEASQNPPLLGAKESSWQSERKSKLDRLETLVRQGQYKVDPFILDELAVRMARLMN